MTDTKHICPQSAPEGSAGTWDAIWQDYSAHDPQMRQLFTRNATTTIYQFWQRCYFEDLLQTVRPQADWQMLELASGRGTTSMYLASRGMTKITLLDLSPAALQQAQANFETEQLPVPRLVQGDAEQTGLSSNSYDLLYNVGVLEHFTDCHKILAESFRILRPGGQIFMPIVPAMPFARSILCRLLFNPVSLAKRLVKRLIGKQPSQKNADMIRTSTDRDEYVRVARLVGFHGVSCLPYNPYWKVNRDGSAIERYLALPLYKLHRAAKKLFGVRPSLKTMSAFGACYLLVAQKPGQAAATQPSPTAHNKS